MTRKYNITIKAPPMLVCMKNTALGECLKANAALGFASCCISLFFIHTHGGALTITYSSAV